MTGSDMFPVMADDTAVTIDLAAYRNNIRAIDAFVGSDTAVMAVVKSEAYGHGMLRCARAAIEAGAAWLGVAHAGEAFALRDAGIETPILVLGSEQPGRIPDMARRDVTFALTSADMLDAAAAYAGTAGKPIRVHVKVDTGMGRLGLVPDDAEKLLEHIAALSGIEADGIFAHLSSADEDDPAFTLEQISRFRDLLGSLEGKGLRPRWAHTANSAGIARFPEARLDLVRPGLATYGLVPFDGYRETIPVAPVLSWHTKVCFVRDVPAGTHVSYGRTFTTARPSRLATIPAGYGDGLSRRLSNRGHALVNGVRVPVAGRICMNLTVLDVTEAGNVAVGDRVTLIGTDGGERITAEDIAQAIGTINYEITTGIPCHIPRTVRETA